MINLTSLRIYLDFKPDQKRVTEKESVLREDGYTEYKDADRTTETLELYRGDLRVTIYIPHYEHEKTWSWNFVLPVIKEYFTSVDLEILRPICEHCIVDVDLGIYSEIPEQSEQDDMFIANYTEWVYLQFDYGFETLFSLDSFKKLLNNVHHTHQVTDRDWPQTKMFLGKKLTVENFSAAFDRLIKLISMEKEINRIMGIARDNCYALYEVSWIEELEGKTDG